VAHDLRGPLTRIRGHIELVLAGPTDAVAYRQALDTALAESERLHRTVDALLQTAQAESGTLGTEMESIDLAAVARDVLDLYQPFAEEKALRTRTADRGSTRGSSPTSRLAYTSRASAIATRKERAPTAFPYYVGEGSHDHLETARVDLCIGSIGGLSTRTRAWHRREYLRDHPRTSLSRWSVL